jgi:hypothetical protein
MRRARRIWSRRRHNLAEARRPESVTAAVDPPLSARQGSGLASRARTRPGGPTALSGATGAFDWPAAALRVYPNRDAVDPRPSGLEDSERGVAEGSGDRDRSGGEPAGARRHSACNAAVFRAVLAPMLSTFRKQMARRRAPTIGIESRRRGHSEREAARRIWPRSRCAGGPMRCAGEASHTKASFFRVGWPTQVPRARFFGQLMKRPCSHRAAL